MNKKSIYKNIDKIFIFFLIIIFFTYNYSRINYGLPFFLNFDETSFKYSTLSFLSFITGYSNSGSYNPIYAPLINLILILKSIFINELLINSLSLDQIKSKIYFNPELFIFYGRLASLTVTSSALFVLYLIFKRLKINFFIYSILLISFSTSLILFDVSTANGKNSYFFLIFLIQLFFFIKYLFKIKNFQFKSYIIFSLLASFAWGVNYWPAFISIYAVFFLHLKKYSFTKINYLIIFLLIFIILGPIVNFLNANPYEFITPSKNIEEFQIGNFIKSFFNDFISSFRITFIAEKNIFLLLGFAPFFLFNKKVFQKKEFLIIFFLIFEPIIILGISEKVYPQLRYFSGNFCIILILTALIFNEFYKSNLKYLIFVLYIFNFYIIFNNLNLNYEVNNVLSKNHSFYEFNNEIKKDRSKVLFLVDLGFQENLKQNLLYMKLYENDLIKKNKSQENFIKKKIEIIKNTKDIIINNRYLKKDITYFNYSFFEIKNLKLFFEFIKQDFEYIVIEEAKPFYTSDSNLQKQIKNYVKKNFELEKIQFNEEKIFLRSQRSVIHYYLDVVNGYDYSENINNDKLDTIYGNKYSLYKLN
jgi:hypothetical protein